MLEIIEHDWKIEKGKHSIIGWKSRYKFYTNGILVFSKDYSGDNFERINVSFDSTYYFILSPTTKSFNIALKHSTEEFPGWNLKLEFTETEDSITIHETYHQLIQDDVEIKQIISSYKDKSIEKINVLGYRRDAGRDTGHDYSIILDGDQITLNDVDQLFNYLLSLDYTNQNYDDTMYAKTGLGLSLEEEIRETKDVVFEDGSTFEINIDSYSGLETGIIIMPEGTFMFSK